MPAESWGGTATALSSLTICQQSSPSSLPAASTQISHISNCDCCWHQSGYLYAIICICCNFKHAGRSWGGTATALSSLTTCQQSPPFSLPAASTQISRYSNLDCFWQQAGYMYVTICICCNFKHAGRSLGGTATALSSLTTCQ
jgi:hypothetical protein